MVIQDSVIKAASCVAACFLLYKTEFFVEYGRIFRLIPFASLIEYRCFKIQNKKRVNYFDFLDHKYSNFFTKLISCPYCLGFWLCLLVSKIDFVLFVYFVYVLLYKTIELMFNHGTRT